ncbi:tetratricopeptide repeat protein [Novipirellula sp.]|uniref:tetratricopeptide repeat protein n=1 Tax=Novipirellula sp. TaxID=2795430 RepID=UPI0035615CC8
MPTTINGIGTQYYGKKNPRIYHDRCDSCGAHCQMTDYETGYYFVVLFIPLIPMGKKQILGDCSNCRRHRVMPLHQWNQLREEAIDTGMAKLAEAPNEPQRAIELLGTLTVFNRPEEAMDLASATLQSHQDDIDVQLGIGSWYENQGRKLEAESCFQRAIELDPEYPPCVRIAAINLLESGQPKLAAQQMESLRHPSENYEPALFLMLAQSYAGAGDHDAALREYADVFANVPEAATDKAIRKQVKKSEKALGRSESILPRKGLFG